MKKIANLIVFACVFVVAANGQITKGYWLLGGSGSFYSYKQTYVSSSFSQTASVRNIDISAPIGYFFIDKFAAGISPMFSTSKNIVDNTSTTSGGISNKYQLAIGPFVRYYFLKTEKQFNILAEMTYQIGINRDLDLKMQGSYNKFLAMVGSEMYFTSSVGIEILVGYNATTQSIVNPTYNYSDIHKGFQTSIGFKIHLERDSR